jgi:hypothetical protein
MTKRNGVEEQDRLEVEGNRDIPSPLPHGEETPSPLLPEDSCCGIPLDHLDQFGVQLPPPLRTRWRTIRRQLRSYQWRQERRLRWLAAQRERLTEQVEQVQAAQCPSGKEEPRWERLRRRLEEIEASEATEEQKRRQMVTAVVSSLDMVLFAQSLEKGMAANKGEVHKLMAQLTGMLTEEAAERPAPVFTWNVIALPGPRDPEQEADFERQLRIAAGQRSAIEPERD